MKQLQGRTALVTGASRGIGRAIALYFVEVGAISVFSHLSNVEQGLARAVDLLWLCVQVRV